MCGAEIEFNAANSLVVVCESCSSIVGRADGRLETYGKVADLVQTESPLQVGAVGEVKGSRFEITGRTQYRHAAGGVWDEWYIAFNGGERWGWLSEAQGRFCLTFKKQLPEGHSIPPIAELQLEDEVLIPSAGRMKVVEVGEAELMSGEGEIPFALKPGERHAYADLQGAGKRFATLDGSEDPPALYYGGEFPIERLGLEYAEGRETKPTSVASQAVTCPHCGGSLELHAPSDSERIACPYCDSLLDIEDNGALKFLHVLKNQKISPLIPLGSKGTLRDREYTVIGFMQRQVRVEGVVYPWQEYLLYTPRQPFHWLVHSQNHWTLGKPISAGDVRAFLRTAYYKDKRYYAFERAMPVVSAVYGEFYWKVEIGERVGAADYVRPPFMLSREETFTAPEKSAPSPDQSASTDGIPQLGRPMIEPVNGPPAKAEDKTQSREVNYTLGEYVPVTEIEEAFQLKSLPRPSTIAPNQPYVHKHTYMQALILLGCALLAGLLVYAVSPQKKVGDVSFTVPINDMTTQYSKSFELKAMRNIQLTISTPESSRWAYLDGGLYNEKTKKLYKFTAGVQQGQAGSGRKRVKYISALPAGTYTMQSKFRFQKGLDKTRTIAVAIRQGTPLMANWLLVVVVLAVWPIAIGIHHLSFEARRWSQSDSSS
jgi:hypothetical protein